MRRRAELVGPFLVVAALGTVLRLLRPPEPLYYDALAYWELSDSFTSNGGFDLLAFDDDLRGYVFPLVLRLVRSSAGLVLSDRVLVLLFNAVLVAGTATVLLPYFAQVVFPSCRLSFLRRLAAGCLVLVLWQGYLDFTLTDFPALALALVALCLAARASARASFGVGLAAAAAVNMRPAYLLLLPAVTLLVLRTGRSSGLRAALQWRVAGALLLGVALVTVPQSLAMARHHDTYSPLPGTGQVAQSGQNLRDFQLTTGLELQRYETYVGLDFPSPQLRYLDPAGDNLRRGLPGNEVRGYGAYGLLVVQHPVTMAGLGVRHVLNGLDQRYDTPYVEDLAGGGLLHLRVVSLGIFGLALVRLCFSAARRGGTTTPRWAYLAALAATCLPALPSAMETRFLLPLHLAALLAVVLPGWRDVVADVRGKAVAGLLLTVYAAAASYVVTATTAQLVVP